jgi:rod shape determining protein RodA
MFTNANTDRAAKVDFLQLLAVLGLMAISIAFVYSATMAGEIVITGGWWRQSWFKQIIWFAVGLAGCGAVCLTDYHTLSRWSLVAYWISIFALMAVLVHGIGSVHYGARRWINLPGFQLQPSEFAKLAFILAMASFLSRPVDELRSPVIFWKAIGMLLLPFLLIIKEPDLGSALVLLPTGVAMLYAAGTPKRYLVLLFAVVGVCGALFLADILFAPPWLQVKMQAYQRDRLLVYFGVDYTRFAARGATAADLQKLKEAQYKDEYNVDQALIAVGSGGLTGKGWLNGQQNILGYLPAAGKHNDFIFSVIAEEKGFVGSVAVLTLYTVILFTGIRIAGQARDRLGKLLAVGVVALIFSHVFINIGMNIRIMPVTGVPLPLLSYGGSSVLGSLIAIGLLQNVHIYRKGY